jgi:hypothetical protein
MLVTPIFNGQGIGNQLACYITTRCLALDKGYDFGVVYPERWKAKFFKNIELPEVKKIEFGVEGYPPINMPKKFTYYREESSDYDPFIKDIPDNYIIHGNLQGEGYFEKYKDQIREWLAVEPLKMPYDTCVIAFRGGEYKWVKEFFLPQSYWDAAIANMKKINPYMKFEVHTDDVDEARKFFPNYKCIHDPEINWRSIRYASYLILSNSSFGWFPAWLGEAKLIIAPLYWQRYNMEYWHLEQNKTKCFTYQDKCGNLNKL